MRVQSMMIVFVLSLLGVWIFTLLHLPVPWLLGPLLTVLFSQFFIQRTLYWPIQCRNIGLIIVGISIGQTFQLEVFSGVSWLLVVMLLTNITMVVVSLILTFLLVKFGKLSLKTALTATVPGGLSQIVTFAEEEKEIDLAVVTYFHVVRVISLVLGVPLILSEHVISSKNEWMISFSSLPALLFLLLFASVSVWVGKKFKLPVPYFLSPVLFVIGLQFFAIKTPEVPSFLLHIAQLMIGAYIGQLLKPHMLKLGKKVLFWGIGAALILLACSYGLGWLLTEIMDYSLATSFLSTAAGGLDQMSLLASAIGADVSTVTVFQMFRLLFVFVILLPLLQVVCKAIDRKQLVDKN